MPLWKPTPRPASPGPPHRSAGVLGRSSISCPPLALLTPGGRTHHREREAHQYHGRMVEYHEELLVQVATHHGPGAAQGSGRPVFPSMPFNLVLVPVAEEHGVDVIDEVGHCKLRVGRGQPVPVGKGERRSMWTGPRRAASRPGCSRGTS